MSKITVTPDGNWKLYTNILPANSTPMGTVTRDDFDTGALVRLSGGNYVQINAGVLRTLDGRKVAAALGEIGRPAEMQGGRRVNVYLDEATIERAKTIGEGNLSVGIRRAVNGGQS